MRRRVWIVSLSAGGGHLAMAAHIRAHLASSSGVEVIVDDVRRHAPPLFRLGTWFYEQMMRYQPARWGQVRPVFELLGGCAPRLASVPRRPGRLEKWLLSRLEEVRPGLVIVNNGWICPLVLPVLKAAARVPVVVHATDPFSGAGRCWAQPLADELWVTSAELAGELAAYCPDLKNRVRLVPYPVPRSCFPHRDNGQTLHVLVNAGTQGDPFFYRVFQDLAEKLPPPAWVGLMCGRNQALLDKAGRHIRRAGDRICLKAVPFARQPSKLYARCDIMVTKPGPATVYEALRAGVRVAVPRHHVMVQERRLLEILEERELGRAFEGTEDLLRLMEEVRQNRQPPRLPKDLFPPDVMDRFEAQVLSLLL